MCVSRFVTYGVKILLRHNKEKIKNISFIHYSMDLPKNTNENASSDIIAIIVPILDATSDKEVRSKIETLCAKNENVSIYVLAIFAEMDTMVELTQWKQNICIINNLCLLDLKSLLKILKDNCRTIYFDFNKSPFIVDEMISVCKREMEKFDQDLSNAI